MIILSDYNSLLNDLTQFEEQYVDIYENLFSLDTIN